MTNAEKIINLRKLILRNKKMLSAKEFISNWLYFTNSSSPNNILAIRQKSFNMTTLRGVCRLHTQTDTKFRLYIFNFYQTKNVKSYMEYVYSKPRKRLLDIK